MDPTASLAILHAPCYGPKVSRTTQRTAEGTRADSIGYSEFYKQAGNLGVDSKYRDVVGHSNVNTRLVDSPRGDAGDNPISVRGDHHLRSAKVFKVTSPGTPLKFAPERWLVVARYEWGGEVVCHVNVHPSPVFTSLVKWRRVMRAAAGEVRKAKARGDLVVLTGDLQTRAAQVWLRRLGLRVWRVGIDYVAYDPRLQRRDAGSRTWTPDGMDHVWMLAEFRLAS
jgi:hypothetical protein